MQRMATVDIGTNTVLLLVAERGSDGQLRAVAEHAAITRLGEGVDRTRRLSPAAVARTKQSLEDYSRIAHGLGAERFAVVGTSAMRDAAGGDELRDRVRTLFGVEARVLTGDEEARLTFRGALSGLVEGTSESSMKRGRRHVPGSAGAWSAPGGSPGAGARRAVFDIGGGSTEVVVGQLELGQPEIAFAASFDVGSVRLTERLVAHDPPTTDELRAVAEASSAALVGVPQSDFEGAPIGVAGTMATLAAVSLGLVWYDSSRVHGHEMALAELKNVVERLGSMRLEERCRVPGMEPKRADVIVAGGIIALSVLDHWGATRVRISDRGVRWGLAEELLS
jgi:exopolyphosphatase/guanosine-5'-triphosphate,3'-diphosphate pyrophosphatase